MTSETDPLAQMVAAFADTWSRRDAAALTALWDFTDPQATYVGAGSPQPMIGEAAIRKYLDDGCQGFAAVVMRPGDLHLRRLGPDLGMAFFPLAWVLQEKPTRKPFGGHVRCTMMMRRCAEGWRIFHYAEAPMAPLLTLQGFYETVAADGLSAIPVRP